MNIKENKLLELKKIAKQNGYTLISKDWEGLHKHYEFLSPNNNVFLLKAKTLLDKGWQKTGDDYLKEMAQIALANYGKLISDKWLGTDVPHEFSFSDNRHFFSLPTDIRKNWPKNPDKYFAIINSRNKSPEQFMNEMRLMAEKEGGKLISNEWFGADPTQKYDFEFDCATPFSFSYNTLRQSGFPKNKEQYFKKRKAMMTSDEDFILELKNLAIQNNCELLSDTWIGSNKNYTFKNENEDLFSLRADTLKIRGWPLDLSNHLYLRNRILMTDEERIEELHLIAKSRGGICCEDKWHGEKALYKFKDANNIEFSILSSNLRKGGWSPKEGLISEPLCRQAMEFIFKTGFGKTKNILTPTVTGYNNNLELDGYSEELKIAFEYQGDPAHWDKNDKKYIQVNFRDEIKKLTCEKLQIILIQIPPIEDKKNKWSSINILNHVVAAVKDKFELLNISLPNFSNEKFSPNLSNINHGVNMLNKLKNKAFEYDIEVLDSSWIGSKQEYNFKFINGTGFTMQANEFMRKPPQSADEYVKRLNSPYGKFKSIEDKYNNFKLLVEQSNCTLLEHEWKGVLVPHKIMTMNNKEIMIMPKDVIYTKNPLKKIMKLF